ncbi:hypothetical protein O3Q51_02995 [Cryomorphaceae bacterium 1068]|nr:hypothetical protein [Cryomorphaceae bacterium 1068]
MIKDIDPPKVEDIALAAVPESNPETGVDEWYIYLINLKEVEITNVIVASRGYGLIEKEKVETSQLRHLVETIPPKSYVKIEPIMEDLFKLNNQYWVSFYIDSEIFDKKYVFLAETIQKENTTEVPLMGRKGVLLK